MTEKEEEVVLHPVDIAHLTNDGWILKLPTTLVDQWKRAPKGTVLGSIYSNPSNKSFSMSLPSLNKSAAGTRNELNIKNDIKNTKIFTRQPDGELGVL